MPRLRRRHLMQVENPPSVATYARSARSEVNTVGTQIRFALCILSAVKNCAVSDDHPHSSLSVFRHFLCEFAAEPLDVVLRDEGVLVNCLLQPGEHFGHLGNCPFRLKA